MPPYQLQAKSIPRTSPIFLFELQSLNLSLSRAIQPRKSPAILHYQAFESTDTLQYLRTYYDPMKLRLELHESFPADTRTYHAYQNGDS